MDALDVAAILHDYDEAVAALRARERIDWPEISAEEVALADKLARQITVEQKRAREGT